MCGIVGILSHHSNAVSLEKLKGMTDAISHRGPDGEGFWMNDEKTVGLGHRRLAIIDLSPEAAQPFSFLGRYQLVYNGEIYNYPELKSELSKKGYNFHTSSDTEVLAAAYDCWKEECLQRFDGMFAFAIWDQKEKQLFAARDRFGEKPFYYHFDGETLVFGSEFKALWAAGVARSWNHLMLLNYLANGHTQNAVDPSLTFYKEVACLPPGHYATFQPYAKTLYVNLYWDLDKQERIKISEEEAVEKFNHFFLQSVKRRLRSDVPVGTSLSGGLDSSSVIAMIQEAEKSNGSYTRHAFTARFPGFEKDEWQYANEIAQKFQLQHHSIEPTLDSFLNEFEELCYYQEQPFGSSSVYAQYKVMQRARAEGITVLLDGQGADEILAGYNKYLHWYLQELTGRFRFGFAMQERVRLQQNHYSFQWGFPNYVASFLPVLANAQLEEIERKRILVHPHISRDYARANYDPYYSVYKPPVSKLNDMLYFNTMQQGLGELLHYADRNSMAFGREVRLPFLNHELVEFIFTLPSELKIHNGFTKWLLRVAMAERLPESIVWRTDKVGYEPPQKNWMEHPALRERIDESRRKLVQQGILDEHTLERPIKAKSAYEAENYDWRYLAVAALS
jgi:asparagine synthase (glutamine-hydrolysing)